ncbi:MAG: ABC transporter ATP-binding protein, partial [Eubacteriales bacterium]|nr:ABC transporter ATP-binding protein [Eubacteriales bacterium]
FINWMAYKYESLQWYQEDMFFLDYQNGMKYEHLEDPKVTELRQKISMMKDHIAGGLIQLYWCYWFVTAATVNIILSVTLTASMLSMTAKGDFNGFFAFINSPLSSVVVLLLIGINVVVQIIASNRETHKSYAIWEEFTKKNIRVNAFLRHDGNDCIIFDMRKLMLNEMSRVWLDKSFFTRSNKNRLKYNTYRTVWTAVMNIALFIFIGAKAYIGVFGIGSFVLYRGTVEKFIEAVSNFGTRIGRLFENNKYLLPLFEYLDLPNETEKGTRHIQRREDNSYEIEFRNVSFKYPRSEDYSLRDVSIKFRIGDKMAVVGMNGSGKTTFIKLLCRLYDPTEGEILLDGVNIKDYNYIEYLELFSVVFQDFSLFSVSIGENVAGSRVYDEERVKECLAMAGFGERLSALEKGVKTYLYRNYENDGIDISGGEAQKIALARALYKNAPFIILDEPTAALDPVAEADVYSKFDDIVGGRTAVYISHRLSSCRFCDDIIVFDKGRIIQRGSHDTLVADEAGKYRELWHAQAQYYN